MHSEPSCFTVPLLQITIHCLLVKLLFVQVLSPNIPENMSAKYAPEFASIFSISLICWLIQSMVSLIGERSSASAFRFLNSSTLSISFSSTLTLMQRHSPVIRVAPYEFRTHIFRFLALIPPPNFRFIIYTSLNRKTGYLSPFVSVHPISLQYLAVHPLECEKLRLLL